MEQSTSNGQSGQQTGLWSAMPAPQHTAGSGCVCTRGVSSVSVAVDDTALEIVEDRHTKKEERSEVRSRFGARLPNRGILHPKGE